MEVTQFDIKNACINAKIEKVIYVEQPKGFEMLGQERKFFLPNKSLYELKQAPLLFFK